MNVRTANCRSVQTLRVVCAALAVLSAAALPAFAAREEPLTSTLRTSVSKVAVYKDGHGLFWREGRARPLDGWLHADYLPYASLGTVGVYTTGDKDLVEMVVSAKQTELTFADPAGLARLLSERIGSRVLLVTIEGKQFEGKLTALVEDMAMLEGNGSLISVKLATVKSATLVDLPLRIKVATDKPVGVAMTYLERGIRWLPSYVIRLVDDKQVELLLRASLVNDAEDLEDSTVYFVVGVPSFAYHQELDPLVLNRIGPAIQPRFDVSQLRSQAAVSAEARQAPGLGAYIPPRELPSLPGEGVGALFMYEVKSVTLKVGEVGMLTVFADKVPYRTVYEWDAEGEDVWQCLELNNTTAMPWTTAPAATYRDWRMIGQDTLKYTPVGAKKNVKVTVSRNIGTSYREEEIDRQLAALKRTNVVYDLITLKASLELTSYQDEPVEIAVSKSVEGELLGDDWGAGGEPATGVETQATEPEQRAAVDSHRGARGDEDAGVHVQPVCPLTRPWGIRGRGRR